MTSRGNSYGKSFFFLFNLTDHAIFFDRLNDFLFSALGHAGNAAGFVILCGIFAALGYGTQKHFEGKQVTGCPGYGEINEHF